MILLLGENDDALLYFKVRFGASKAATYPYGVAYRGKIGNEEFILASLPQSNFASLLLTDKLISEFSPYMAIHIGSIVSFDPTLHQGDFLIPDRIYGYGADFSGDGVNIYGQVPGFPPFFTMNTSLNNQLSTCVYDAGNHYVKRGFLLSGEKLLSTQEQFETLKHDHFAANLRLEGADNTSLGVAMSCYLNKVTLLSLLVVGNEIGKPEQTLLRKRTLLNAVPSLGKSIDRLIIELERT